MQSIPCPLCGVSLEFPARPESPKATLDRLGQHFSTDCAETGRLAASDQQPAR